MAWAMPRLTSTNTSISLLVIILLMYYRRHKRRKMHPPLPPGPFPLPIVGNALALDSGAPWVTYEKWGKTYGDLIYTRLLNKEFITINSEKVAKDLLYDRSNNYSDRPAMGVIPLTGQGFNSVLFRYGEPWRQHRRIFHQAFRMDAARNYRPLQLRKVHQLLCNLLEKPDEYGSHFSTLSASIIMVVTYGYDAASSQDPLVSLVASVLDMVVTVLTPETSAIIDAFPFLKSLPHWFPGAGFQVIAQKCRDMTPDVIEKPFQYAKQHMNSINSIPCMVSDLLNHMKDDEKSPEFEHIIKEAACTGFGAASETTTSTLHTFLLAMTLHPEVQKRAQDEIDAVVGKDRLPDYSDRPSLPFVEAILRETLRWFPAVPLCIPHAAVDEDIYEGYYIPKGVTVIPNTWAMCHNEVKYPNPSEFQPERFFSTDGKLNEDTVSFVFGFGRRACAGRHVADASLWAAMACMLAVLNIRKPRDEQGKDIDFVPKWVSGVTSRPLTFPCCIEPRMPGMTSEKLAQMVNLNS